MKLKKMIIVILVIFILFNIICYNRIYADSTDADSAEGLEYGTMQTYIAENTPNGVFSKDTWYAKIIALIIRIMQVAGSGVAVIWLTIDAIKCFTCIRPGGDPKELAGAKHRLVRSLIVCVIIFGAVGFFEVLYQALIG